MMHPSSEAIKWKNTWIYGNMSTRRSRRHWLSTLLISCIPPTQPSHRYASTTLSNEMACSLILTGYCNSVLDDASVSSTQKLQRVQNKAARSSSRHRGGPMRNRSCVNYTDSWFNTELTTRFSSRLYLRQHIERHVNAWTIPGSLKIGRLHNR